MVETRVMFTDIAKETVIDLDVFYIVQSVGEWTFERSAAGVLADVLKKSFDVLYLAVI